MKSKRTFRIENDTIKTLQKEADKRDRTLTSIVLKALDNYADMLEKEEKKLIKKRIK